MCHGTHNFMYLNILMLAECQLECVFCIGVKVLYTVHALSSALLTLHSAPSKHCTPNTALLTLHITYLKLNFRLNILQTLHCIIHSTQYIPYTALCTVILLTVHTPEIPFAKCHLQASDFLPSNAYLPPIFSTIYTCHPYFALYTLYTRTPGCPDYTD